MFYLKNYDSPKADWEINFFNLINHELEREEEKEDGFSSQGFVRVVRLKSLAKVYQKNPEKIKNLLLKPGNRVAYCGVVVRSFKKNEFETYSEEKSLEELNLKENRDYFFISHSIPWSPFDDYEESARRCWEENPMSLFFSFIRTDSLLFILKFKSEIELLLDDDKNYEIIMQLYNDKLKEFESEKNAPRDFLQEIKEDQDKRELKPGPLITINGKRIFPGFPYIMTRLGRLFYHIILLPSTWSYRRLYKLAAIQTKLNRLETYLVYSLDHTVYFSADEMPILIKTPPSCSAFATDKLLPFVDIPDEKELLERRARLERAIQEGAYWLRIICEGDYSKGGRKATPEEIIKLSGFQPNGVPKGLDFCHRCHHFRGQCLDPDPIYRGMIMRVYCLCENDSRCARCFRPMAKYKLSANYYNAKTKQIIHVPGYSGLIHVCPDIVKKRKKRIIWI